MYFLCRNHKRQRNQKAKQSVIGAHTKEFPTIDLNEDCDFNFPPALNGMIGEEEPIIRALDNGASMALSEDVHYSASIPSISRHMEEHSSNKEQQSHVPDEWITKGLNDATTKQDFTTVDTMVPKAITSEEGVDSAREMWLGREFNDCEAFRRCIAKFTIYINFTLEHVRTNMTQVTARCKDANCPWRIHASRVESGLHFKVRKYIAIHSCSKPMMGTAHP